MLDEYIKVSGEPVFLFRSHCGLSIIPINIPPCPIFKQNNPSIRLSLNCEYAFSNKYFIFRQASVICLPC